MAGAIPQIHQPRSQGGFAWPADGSGETGNPSAAAGGELAGGG